MKIKLHLLAICALGLLTSCTNIKPAAAQTQLANPSFEEDAANVGNPDGWEIGKGAQVKVVSGNASEGNRALLVENGYNAVYQDLQIPLLANQQISFSLDAKSVSADAVIGARIGYFTNDNKWHDAALLWNKPITAEYTTYSASRTLPADAKPGRLYIGIYCPDKKSTFYIDNVKLQINGGLSDADAHRAVALSRDAQYFLNRLNAASNENIPLLQANVWKKQAQQIIDTTNAADESLSGKLADDEHIIQSLNTQLFNTLANGKPLLTGWTPAFGRLAPDALPPHENSFTKDLLSLRGEHQAFGIDVANGTAAPQKIAIQTQGLPASCNIIWRRQVFTETWYTKGKTLIADPLTKLASDNKNTFIEVKPGEIVQLYADIDVTRNTQPGDYPIKIDFTEGNKLVGSRILNLQVSPKAAPAPRMAHYAFLYLTSPIIANHTAEAVRDLVDHGVTDIEWASPPPAIFDSQGNLQKVNFTFYDRMLKDFGPSTIRLNTFWQSSYTKFKTADGTVLKVLSPEWKNALVQLFQAWIKHAQEKGVNADRITVLTKDEIHSATLEKSPDESIDEYIQIAQLLHDKIPGLKNYLTLTFYAFPNDVQKVLPQVDVAMPHIPQPEKLMRNAPPTYNPRKAFAEEVYPLLHQAHDEHGLKIWSYHVAPGRSDDALQWNRFYPVLAAATGHTGIAFWAYNVSRGSTWNDTDGGLLDYNFVYDGAEKNPICQQYNVTGETIVPSIRWEAVRAGLQDANIILALQAAEDAGHLSTTQQTKLKELLDQAKLWNGSDNDTAKTITEAKVEEMSQQLREIYAG